MNERIRELMQDSPIPVGYIGNWGRVRWNENVYPQLGDDLYAGVDLQKFAELIVKECADIVEGLSPGYDDYRNQIEDAFRRDCVEKIKEHFEIK